ncbi:MAG: hypothetical protein RBU21_12765 [FCB group bacterium]|jgi:hypothetical protein|nr:hypothetical protein [FCB group bacterium]
MNTKNRALLWEETRVGGTIALTTLAGGLVGMLPFLGNYRKVTDETLILFPTLGFSLLAALLLTLNTANSGHLMGGFSRRILRLPVDIWSTVLIILLSRLAAVLVVSGLLAAVSWGLFGSGPGADTVLLLGMAYLLFQVLDWLRAPAAPLVVMIIAALLLVLLMHVSGFKPVPGSMLDASHLLLAFPPAVGLAYAASLAAVGYTRRGAKLALPAKLVPRAKTGVGGGKRRKAFSTPAAAQYWFERRHAGLLLPVATVICWMLTVGLYILVRPTTAARETFTQTTFLLEVAPFFALVGAAIVWHLRVDRIQFWRRSRPASYFLRLPVEPVDLVRARIAISALTFVTVWLIASLVVRLNFMNPLLLDLLQSAMANGEITGREATALIISLPLLLGLLGWIAAHVPWKLLALEFFLGFTISAFHELHMLRFILYPLGVLMIALPLGWFGAQLGRAWRKGLLPGWSLFACLLLWLAVGFAIFPYGFLNLPPHPAIMGLATASIAALVVMPFPKLLLAAPGHLVGERTGKIFAARPGKGFTARRGLGLAVLLAVFLSIAWVRAIAEPTALAKLRAEGIPTSYAELEASYSSVPAASNRAERYLSLTRELRKAQDKWWTERTRRIASRPHDGGDFAAKGLVHIGSIERLNNAEPIPQQVWEDTEYYWQYVGVPITSKLHAVADSRLGGSRYPFHAGFPRNGRQQDNIPFGELIHLLRLKTLVAAVDDRPEDVSSSLTDLIALSDSLRDYPGFVGQSFREGCYRAVRESLESAINRQIFADKDLHRFQSIVHLAIPPYANFGMLAATRNESLASALERIHTLKYTAFFFTYAPDDAEGPLEDLMEAGLSPALDLLGWRNVAYLQIARSYSGQARLSAEQRRLGYLPKLTHRERMYEPASLLPPTWQHMSYISAFDFSMEWQAQTNLSLAETGIAVERYRQANGSLPENLAQLVPAFIDRVPLDPFNEGAPFHYRVREDGGYLIYSFGWNRADDNGNPQQDYCFAVNSLALRARPQIATQTEEAPAQSA